MHLLCLRENEPGETRVAVTPDTAKKFRQIGLDVEIERGAGHAAGFGDAAYEAAGARLAEGRSAALSRADIAVKVRPLAADEISHLKKGALSVSFLDPFRRRELVEGYARAGLRTVSLEMMPRTTIAQKMDALSSQASLAGYAAAILAAGKLDKVFPMMMTPSGTLAAAKVFVIGAGVAGLQAIATARRLGAAVTAFDTRPVAEEQVKSLGARFLKVDLGHTGQTEQGYARELTVEQLQLQKNGMAKACADSDVVITTAQVFGRPAPRLITGEMLAGMRPGSLVLDMAVSTGGNVEGSEPDREVDLRGVQVIGCSNLPATLPRHASQMLASNILSFLTHFWNKDAAELQLPGDDEIVRGCLLTQDGKIIHPSLQS